MRARIYRNAKSSTQSGVTRTRDWVLDFEPSDRERNDPLMGWWGSRDMQGQVKLRFDSQEEAVAYARKHGIAFEVEIPPPARPVKAKAYADNFKYGRSQNWTH